MRFHNPFNELMSFENYINELFNDAFGPAYHGRGLPFRRRTPIDVRENDHEFLVRIDLPGYEKDNIGITSQESSLEITAARKEEDAESYQLRERSFGELRRSVEFSTRIDADKMTAEYVNGVLTVHCPKAANAKPRQIPVIGE